MAKVYESVIQHGAYGKNITIREYNTKTKQVSFKEVKNTDYIPEIYSEQALDGFEQSSFKTFDKQKPLFVKHFKKTSDLQRLVNPNKMTDEEKELKEKFDNDEISDKELKRLEFLKEFRGNQNKEIQKDYYGNTNRIQKIIREKYPNPIQHDHDFHTIYLDIETRSGINKKGFPNADIAPEEVTVIQIYCTKRKEYFIFGRKDWTGSYESKYGKVNYEKYEEERDLLERFINFIESDYPAIIYGFNSQAFDYPYLVNRIDNEYPELDVNRLSPVHEVQRDVKMKTNDDREFLGCVIKGIHLLDMRDLVLKYGFLSIPNFSLETVSTEGYGIEGKHKHSAITFNDFDSSYTGKNVTINTKDSSRVNEDEKDLWESFTNRKLIEEELEKRGLRNIIDKRRKNI